jgi:hypothetical protein
VIPAGLMMLTIVFSVERISQKPFLMKLVEIVLAVFMLLVSTL